MVPLHRIPGDRSLTRNRMSELIPADAAGASLRFDNGTAALRAEASPPDPARTLPNAAQALQTRSIESIRVEAGWRP